MEVLGGLCWRGAGGDKIPAERRLRTDRLCLDPASGLRGLAGWTRLARALAAAFVGTARHLSCRAEPALGVLQIWCCH